MDVALWLDAETECYRAAVFAPQPFHVSSRSLGLLEHAAYKTAQKMLPEFIQFNLEVHNFGIRRTDGDAIAFGRRLLEGGDSDVRLGGLIG